MTTTFGQAVTVALALTLGLGAPPAAAGPVLDRVQELGRRQADVLHRLAGLPNVSNARQLGTIIAVDIAAGQGLSYLSPLAPEMLQHFREHRVLLRPLGNTLYIMPPYCIGKEDLARLHDVAADVIGFVTCN